jgi:hypothetical protein
MQQQLRKESAAELEVGASIIPYLGAIGAVDSGMTISGDGRRHRGQE